MLCKIANSSNSPVKFTIIFQRTKQRMDENNEVEKDNIKMKLTIRGINQVEPEIELQNQFCELNIDLEEDV
jgi:hypothetical protein